MALENNIIASFRDKLIFFVYPIVLCPIHICIGSDLAESSQLILCRIFRPCGKFYIQNTLSSSLFSDHSP